MEFGHTRDAEFETVWVKGATGARVIEGTASTPRIDNQNESLSSRGAKAKLPIHLFSQHARKGPPIGEVFYLRKSAGEVFIKARIFEGVAADHAWALIVDGQVKCLSVGIEDKVIDGIVDGTKFYKSWTIKEISLCREGANPDCKLRIVST